MKRLGRLVANILTSEDLLEQQLKSITERKDIRPKPVELSKATGIEYNALLKKLVREIKKDVNQLLPLLRQLAPEYQTDSVISTNDSLIDTTGLLLTTNDGYVTEITSALRRLLDKWSSPEFRSVAARMASQFVRTANTVNGKRFSKSMKSFGIDIFGDDPSLQEYVDASIFDNTRLITSIPEQYLTQVESIVMTNIRAGGRPSSIAKLLQKQFDVTENRAKMIARDQTAKVNGDLNKKRQLATGFEYFQWLTSEDERVRDRHDDISDKITAYGKGIYRWDNPPLSENGTPIIPGQDFQCRCTGRPVSQREVDENVKAGRTRPGVKR